jgi:hypothetical protein
MRDERGKGHAHSRSNPIPGTRAMLSGSIALVDLIERSGYLDIFSVTFCDTVDNTK